MPFWRSEPGEVHTAPSEEIGTDNCLSHVSRCRPIERYAPEMSPWLPTELVIILTAVALTEAGASPATAKIRRLWMAGIILTDSLAIVGAVWQGQRMVDASAALAGTTASPEASNRERNGPTVSDLTKQVRALEDHIRELEAAKQVRTITTDNADKLAAYLRQFGNRRVIVSCIPEDIEAYQYANQLVNILKAGNWNAQGPQVTKIFGDVPAPGINVYVNGEDHSDTVKILLDGFAKFNIPYQSRVTPSQAIPDTETVELFIGTKQSQSGSVGGD